MTQKRTTIYDIAREAGVSAATVTRVLNGSARVRENTREKVQQIIDHHGYAPSSVAQDLGSGNTRTLGVILPDIRNPYFAALVSSADAEARRHGYSIWLYQLPKKGEITAQVIDSLITRRLSGAFFIGGFYDIDRPDLREMLARLGKYMPIVAICPPREGLGFICMYNDLDNAMRSAVRHLHSLGHRRFAMIGGAANLSESGSRALSFLDELNQLGLPQPMDYGHLGGGTPEDGQQEILRLMTVLPSRDRPTAIIAYNDLVALGAMHQLRRMGFRIPEDVAVIGCDNQFFCPYTSPPLTSIDMQAAEHACDAVRELLSASENRSAAIVRGATLVVRESCGVALGWRDRS
ncbi:MAG: LacI family transcriptional regulator [Clostridiales bacterium]|nr:LacI family transcriptional regulator [Clostridiales bacterium]